MDIGTVQKYRSLLAECLEIVNDQRGWERDVRAYLWLSHGHQGMYGDDGEMQCVECAPYGVMDYKRQPLADVVRAASQARIDVNLARAKRPTPRKER